MRQISVSLKIELPWNWFMDVPWYKCLDCVQAHVREFHYDVFPINSRLPKVVEVAADEAKRLPIQLKFISNNPKTPLR
jgi:hypothetical protein